MATRSGLPRKKGISARGQNTRRKSLDGVRSWLLGEKADDLPVEPTLEQLIAAAALVDPVAYEVVGKTIRRKRDPRITRAALKRAGGVSEFSGQPFPWGLQVCHIVALQDDGPDSLDNVVVLTPNEHARFDADPEFKALIIATVRP